MRIQYIFVGWAITALVLFGVILAQRNQLELCNVKLENALMEHELTLAHLNYQNREILQLNTDLNEYNKSLAIVENKWKNELAVAKKRAEQVKTCEEAMQLLQDELESFMVK